jgi:hypothetical protein
MNSSSGGSGGSGSGSGSGAASSASARPAVQFATYGDMGTYLPFGHTVFEKLAAVHLNEKGKHAVDPSGIGPFDFVLHQGDISYAGVDSSVKILNMTKNDEVEATWDLFGRMIQPVAATVPYMVGAGKLKHCLPSTTVCPQLNTVPYNGWGRQPRSVVRLGVFQGQVQDGFGWWWWQSHSSCSSGRRRRSSGRIIGRIGSAGKQRAAAQSSFLVLLRLRACPHCPGEQRAFVRRR